jgi:undecaprenyl-diphosphatase
MVGGLLRGLDHEASAHFSFLIATPVILGAAALEVPKLLHGGGGHFTAIAFAAGATAGIVAFLSVWVLMRYFKRREFQALDPFAYYCWGIGTFTLLMLAFGL